MSLQGLSSKQVAQKIAEGKANRTSNYNHNSIPRIILKNTLTIFNLVNLILATMILIVGSYKNLLFVLIAIANTLISIINEIRAKRTVDKMRLTSEQRPTVIRDGKTLQIDQTDIVEGDLLVYSLGDQILVDCRLEEGTVEVNESFVTGEQDNITKKRGDKLISGSFVVSGTCKATATAVGAKSELNKIEQTARKVKTADSQLFRLMNNIVKYISFALIPIGALLLWARFRVPDTTTEVAVTSTVAALINMIPEGLILLTSSVLALATIRLSRRKVLVQDLYSVETLARVDTIALDKTGTLTSGQMTVHDYTPTQKSFERALASILSHQTTENATITALKQKFAKKPNTHEIGDVVDIINFSSERKCSGIRTKDATYLLGAIDFITDDESLIAEVKSASEGYRTLAVVRRENGMLGQSEAVISKHSTGASSHFYNGHGRGAGTEIPGRVRLIRCKNDDCEPRTLRNSASDYSSDTLLGFIRLEDEIRPDAKQIINYFYRNDIDVKIISGDDLEAVTKIATRVGVRDLKGINLSDLKSPDYDKLVKEYSIFTRVTPTQKKDLIKAMKKQGSTVAMTGDGVNDILAMKEADCSLAIGAGSDAARRSAKLVLLNSDFAAVPSIIDEGRQSINNLERSTALFLAKTVYASILAILFVFLPFTYPFTPIEMSLLNFACIGFPGLILALEHNTNRIKNRFTRNILTYSFPIGLTVSCCMAALSVVSHLEGFTHPELTTISVFVTFSIDLILIYWISKPLNPLRTGLLLTIISIMVAAFAVPFARDFFEFVFLSQQNLIVMLIIILSGIAIFFVLKFLMQKLANRILGPEHI
ncbi:MAG: HAD-IC family P-type ATPase [Candidatus Saccharibacteria bacterium]|nr:HAD-IC family P-type ATPase [Candidatus Saccharibacteria bacterium]